MSDAPNTSFSKRIANQPAFQAAVIFVFGCVLCLLDKSLSSESTEVSVRNSPWIIMTACILFYALCSSVLSLKTKNQNIYWRNAILSFVALMILSALIAMAISGLSIDEAGSFRWLFVVLAVGYLVFLTIVRLMRRIVEIAIKQDERLRGQ